MRYSQEYELQATIPGTKFVHGHKNFFLTNERKGVAPRHGLEHDLRGEKGDPGEGVRPDLGGVFRKTSRTTTRRPSVECRGDERSHCYLTLELLGGLSLLAEPENTVTNIWRLLQSIRVSLLRRERWDTAIFWGISGLINDNYTSRVCVFDDAKQDGVRQRLDNIQ